MTTVQKMIKYCAIALAVFLIIGIIRGILGAAAFLPAFLYEEDAAREWKTYAVTETVKDLEIRLGGARLEIQTGDHFSVKSSHKSLKVEHEDGDGVLLIKEDPSTVGFRPENAQVVLTVPEDCTLGKVTISMGAGTVKADTLRTEKLSLNLGAGKVDMGNLTVAASASIKNGVGELKIRGGELANVDLGICMGGADLKSRLTGDCSLDCGVGEMKIRLLGKREDYGITLDKGAGKATLGGIKMAENAMYGNGENIIQIIGRIGKTKIGFVPVS